MEASIITIGDELLIGQVVDTNSAFVGSKLNLSGITVKEIVSISDNRNVILHTLDRVLKQSDVVIITGGLGPTNDDLTKKTLCEFFSSELVFNEEVYKDVEKLFASFGKTVTPINREQALVPDKCKVLRNANGTAPGMLFEHEGKAVFSLPGVPYEMKALLTEQVIPYLKQHFKLPHIFHKTVLTHGIGESMLAEKIEQWESDLGMKGIKLAYLPSAGSVRLRLTMKGMDANLLMLEVDEQIDKLEKIIPEFIYGIEIFGEDNNSIAAIVGEMLAERKLTLTCAESCTGGYLSHLITAVPECSRYFKGGVIAYDNAVKVKSLGVSEYTLQKYGAVSEETVKEMAVGALNNMETDFALAVSGIAGPSGGSSEKPVGTVWIACAGKDKVIAACYRFGNNRLRVIERAAKQALVNLLAELNKNT